MIRKGIVPLVVLVALVSIVLESGHGAQSAEQSADSEPGQQAPPSAPVAAGAPTYTYLFNFAGDFLKVDTSTQTVVSKGTLRDFDPNGEIVPKISPSGYSEWGLESCAVCYKGLQYDPVLGRLYILATEGPGLTRDGTSQSRVIAFSLPDFELVASAELDHGGGSMLVTPGGDRVLVNHSRQLDALRSIDVIDFYDSRTMIKIGSIEEVSMESWHLRPLHYGSDAYFLDEETIYDPSDAEVLPDRVLKITDNSIVVAERKSKSGFEQQTLHAWEQLKLDFPEEPTTFVRPFWGLGRKYVVLEKIYDPRPNWSYENREDRVDRNLGDFTVYNVETGEEKIHFQDPELAGFAGEVRCLSRDGDTLYYSVRQENTEQAYMVSIRGTSTVVTRLEDPWAPGLGSCVFSDR